MCSLVPLYRLLLLGVAVFGQTTEPTRAHAEQASKGSLEADIRTDLVDKTVLAIKLAYNRSVHECGADAECSSKRAELLAASPELVNEMMSKEAIALVDGLRAGRIVDWGAADAWLDRAGRIQKNYFESVFQYHERGVDVQDALFYLDIGETHKAVEELLANQRILTQILADYSALLEIAQAGRSGLAAKLVSQLLDLRPYHETFGCAHSTNAKDPNVDCGAVMRMAFKKSFSLLQDTLTRFFTDEIPETALAEVTDVL